MDLNFCASTAIEFMHRHHTRSLPQLPPLLLTSSSYHRARAQFGKQTAALLALADQLAQTQTVDWPKRKTKKLSP